MVIPNSDKLSINILSGIFDNTTNSYKYYWFLAILEELSETNSSRLDVEDLSIRMLSEVWYPLDYYKLSFGVQDSFKSISHFLADKMEIDDGPNSKDLFSQINEKLDQQDLLKIKSHLIDLIRYVPYRFIRPFFRNELRGLKDSFINGKIIQLANQEFENKKPLYCFIDNYIIIHDDWFEYFKKHLYILKSFAYWHLLKFVQKNNPNVIGLSEKLFKPNKRVLNLAINYWKNFLAIKKEVKCIYSDQLLNDNISVDHFIPWSYIAHDQIWNLVPTLKSVNSSKGNNLPSHEKYFNKFAELQFDAYKTIYNSELKTKRKLLEEYSLLFNTELQNINQFSYNKFHMKLEETLHPMIISAKNLGFHSDWIYK